MNVNHTLGEGQATCPTCGHCPTCGRSNSHGWQWYYRLSAYQGTPSLTYTGTTTSQTVTYS